MPSGWSETPLRADPTRPPRPWGLSSSVYNNLLLACVLLDAPTWFSSKRRIDCKSKNQGVFSLVQTVVRNAPNFDANPLRQTCTIFSSSTFTLIEARDSHMFLILEVCSSTNKSLCRTLVNSCLSWSFLAMVLASKIFFKFPQASFGVLASRM